MLNYSFNQALFCSTIIQCSTEFLNVCSMSLDACVGLCAHKCVEYVLDSHMTYLKRMSAGVQRCWPHRQHTLQHEINVLWRNVNARWLLFDVHNSKTKWMHRQRAVLDLKHIWNPFNLEIYLSQSIINKSLRGFQNGSFWWVQSELTCSCSVEVRLLVRQGRAQ